MAFQTPTELSVVRETTYDLELSEIGSSCTVTVVELQV